MRQCRSLPQVTCQGHQVQIFADLSPSTIQKQRSLKPLLMVLSQRDIKYRWAFPFAVKFTLNGKMHSFSNLPDGEKIFLSLKEQRFPTPGGQLYLGHGVPCTDILSRYRGLLLDTWGGALSLMVGVSLLRRPWGPRFPHSLWDEL